MKEIYAELLTCEQCGETNDTVERCFDPYCLDVHNKEVECVLRDRCYAERSEDI